jgi:hypothetical protein
MNHLVPCPSCARHVRQSEPACPFCSVQLALGHVSPPALPRSRLGRAATFAFGASLVGATSLVACGGESETSKPDGGGADTRGGSSPGGTSAAGTGGAAGAGGSSAGTFNGFGGNIAPPYGIPPMGGYAPAYGVPPIGGAGAGGSGGVGGTSGGAGGASGAGGAHAGGSNGGAVGASGASGAGGAHAGTAGSGGTAGGGPAPVYGSPP